VWLVRVTDPGVVRSEWPTFAVLFVLVYLFERLSFFFSMEVRRSTHANLSGSASDIVVWSAVLMFGPTAVWLIVFWGAFQILREWRGAPSAEGRWRTRRLLVMGVADATIPTLIALALFRRWGGEIPLAGLTGAALLPAAYATIVRAALVYLISAPFVLMLMTSPALGLEAAPRRVFLRFAVISAFWPLLIAPFALLAAGLHAEAGLGAYLYLMAGALLASLLAHRLSLAADRSWQRSRELERLERFGEAVLRSPPDASELADLLEEYVADMFPFSAIEIRLFPDRTLLRHPESVPPVEEPIWEWIDDHAVDAHFFPQGSDLPWGGQAIERSYVVAPMIDTELLEPIGGVVLRRRPIGADPERSLPAVQSLAAQIASALHGARVYERTIEHQQIEQELAVAAGIQASFMPRVAPDVPGWEFRATIYPARDASGDFVDLIPLDDGRWGLLIADVSGKGMPAALYMALSRTLIRTFAFERDGVPARVVGAANARMLADTDNELFLTAFFGVLDPANARLVYCNAGHNPPYLLRAGDGGAIEELAATGLPLGMLETTEWEDASVHFEPGDTLVLYTDGVLDAENEDGETFGEKRLAEAARDNLGKSAIELRDALSGTVLGFVGTAPQVDDITLMIVVREPAAET